MVAVVLAAGGCDLVAGIGTFCEVGVDPGCGAGGGAAGAGGTGGGVCKPEETMGCYSGPAGTEGVGACKTGVATCSADGTGFGACENEVLPGKETCEGDKDRDEDCDGKECAYWSAGYGTAAEQGNGMLAVNDKGEIFLSAYTKEEAVPFGDFSVGGENSSSPRRGEWPSLPIRRAACSWPALSMRVSRSVTRR
jgi:hypothetical protein